MQVKILYEPVQLADLFSPGIAVLPIFVNEEEFLQAQMSTQYLQKLALAFIERNGVSVLKVPTTLSVMLIAVHKKHNKKKILRKAQQLYDSIVTANYDDFLTELPGLVAVDVLPYGGMNAPTYRFWNSKRGIVISTGNADLDKLFKGILQQPGMLKYTATSLQHPGVLHAFEIALFEHSLSIGFELSINTVNLYRTKAFVSVEVYPTIEVSND